MGMKGNKNAYKNSERSSTNRSRLYSIWIGIKARCYNNKDTTYKYYGGKGINVCDEWKDDYLAFKNWALANGYEDNLTIDRKNSKQGYSPSNCQWITQSENIRNAMKEHFKEYQYKLRLY